MPERKYYYVIRTRNHAIFGSRKKAESLLSRIAGSRLVESVIGPDESYWQEYHLAGVCGGIERGLCPRCMRRMSESDDFGEPDPKQLIHGPYAAIAAKPGDELTCAIHGPVAVRSIHAAPIPWPIAQKRGLSLIVCGDLERAVRSETAQAVAHHWGLNAHTVGRMRAQMNISARDTDGFRRATERNGRAHADRVLAQSEAALRLTLDPEVRARRDESHSEAMKGRKPSRKAVRHGRDATLLRLNLMSPEERREWSLEMNRERNRKLRLVEEMRADGYEARDIAEALSMKLATVRSWVKRIDAAKE